MKNFLYSMAYCFIVLGVSLSSRTWAMPHVEISAEGGRDIYDQYCARCHGPNLVNPGGSSFDLRKFPSDEKERFLRSVTEGRNSMPSWQGTLSEAEIEAVWLYVLSKQKS
jgi:mono/diheme cytochrome c family protein